MAVELRKGQKVNLDKQQGHSYGEILINLNWNQTIQAKKVFLLLFQVVVQQLTWILAVYMN